MADAPGMQTEECTDWQRSSKDWQWHTRLRPSLVHQFKAPQYSGTGDFDNLFSQFHEVAGANARTEEARLLHRREALKSKAEDCGQSDCEEAVFDTLRARFSFSPKQAWCKLSTLRRAIATIL